MYSDFVFLYRFLFELSCKNTHTHTDTHTHTHTDSNEYPIVAFSKNATIIKNINSLFYLYVCDMLARALEFKNATTSLKLPL